MGVIYTVWRGDSPDRGNVCYNKVGRGLAPAARCPNSENFAPAAGFAVNYGTGTDRSLRTKNNGSVEGDDTVPQNHTKTTAKPSSVPSQRKKIAQKLFIPLQNKFKFQNNVDKLTHLMYNSYIKCKRDLNKWYIPCLDIR